MTLDKSDKRKLIEKLFGHSGHKEINHKSPEPSHNVPRKESKKRKSCLSAKTKHSYKQSSMALEHGDNVQCITDETNSAVFSMYNQVIISVQNFK